MYLTDHYLNKIKKYEFIISSTRSLLENTQK